MRTGPVALRIRAAALSKLTKRFLTRLKRAYMSVTLTSKSVQKSVLNLSLCSLFLCVRGCHGACACVEVVP